ncbi:MAG: hypothetical protein J2P27_02730 [Actinobacteria bacterium]|nr:hypothetical protein [Actinomycetota bacterium]
MGSRQGAHLAGTQGRHRPGRDYGPCHLGYEIQGDKYNKRLVPTDECRTYEPQVLTRIA